jgi:hypothetical protein
LANGQKTRVSSWCIVRVLNYRQWPVTIVYCSFYSDQPILVSEVYDNLWCLRCLQRGFALARLMELRPWILTGRNTSLLGVVGCQIDVSVTDRSRVKMSPTESGETERDCEGSKMKKTTPTRGGRGIQIITDYSIITILIVCWHLKIAYIFHLLIPIYFRISLELRAPFGNFLENTWLVCVQGSYYWRTNRWEFVLSCVRVS